MTKEIILRDVTELEARLSELDITVAQAPDGLLTVYSNSEPRFCFDATSIDEAQRVTTEALSSYARVFFNVNAKVNLTIRETDDIVPIEKVRPVSQVHASIDLLAA